MSQYLTIVVEYSDDAHPKFSALDKLSDIDIGEHRITAVQFNDALREIEEMQEQAK